MNTWLKRKHDFQWAVISTSSLENILCRIKIMTVCHTSGAETFIMSPLKESHKLYSSRFFVCLFVCLFVWFFFALSKYQQGKVTLVAWQTKSVCASFCERLTNNRAKLCPKLNARLELAMLLRTSRDFCFCSFLWEGVGGGGGGERERKKERERERERERADLDIWKKGDHTYFQGSCQIPENRL